MPVVRNCQMHICATMRTSFHALDSEHWLSTVENMTHGNGHHLENIKETYRHLLSFFNISAAKPAFTTSQVPDGGIVVDARGWKVATLTDPLQARFQGIAHGSYTLNDNAVCNTTDHPAPELHCRCGFHSYNKLPAAVRIWAERLGTVLLRVELYGKIIEHQTGSRAEQQEISAVHLPGVCEVAFCHGRTVGIRERQRNWLSACSKHIDSDRTRALHASELRNLWKVDVVIGEPNT